MPRGQREKQREQQKKERQRQERSQPALAETATPEQAETVAAPAPDLAVAELVGQLAEQLGESAPEPLAQIERIVRAMGRERTLALLEQTLAIEAQGGELLADGSRRRTPGGLFFKLVRKHASKAEVVRIFYPAHESVTVLSNEELAALLADCAQWPRATPRRADLKIRGRPTHIPPPDLPPETPYVALTMVGRPQLPEGMGHGLPPIAGASMFRVLMATKRWLELAPRLLARDDSWLWLSGSAAISAKRADLIAVRANHVLLATPYEPAAPGAPAAKPARKGRQPPAQEQALVTGVVKWFSAEKGFGFISSPALGDVYLPLRALADGRSTLGAGEPVCFTVRETPRGPEALQVRAGTPPAAPKPAQPTIELAGEWQEAQVAMRLEVCPADPRPLRRAGKRRPSAYAWLVELGADSVGALPAGLPPPSAPSLCLVLVPIKNWEALGPGWSAGAGSALAISGMIGLSPHAPGMLTLYAYRCKPVAAMPASHATERRAPIEPGEN